MLRALYGMTSRDWPIPAPPRRGPWPRRLRADNVVPMISPDEEFLTVAEVATILKLNKQTVRNWIDAGALPAVRVGTRRVRIRRSDFEHFLEQGETRPARQPANEQTPAQAFWEGELQPAPLASQERE